MAEVSNNWLQEELDDSLHSKTMIINMGPAHPATHGTIRLIIELDGERVERCDVDPGYLHRGFEKQCETVTLQPSCSLHRSAELRFASDQQRWLLHCD